MKHSIVGLLAERQIRPRRVYNGEFVASRCGRFVSRIGGGKSGITAAPNGVLISDDKGLADLAAREGRTVLYVKDFKKETLVAEHNPQIRPRAVLQAIEWILKEGRGQLGSGMPRSGLGAQAQAFDAGLRVSELEDPPGMVWRVNGEAVPAQPLARPNPAARRAAAQQAAARARITGSNRPGSGR